MKNVVKYKKYNYKVRKVVFMSQKSPKYKRILLKLSGEALAASDGILDFDFIASVADVLKKCMDGGIEVGVIVGAGNIWRGRQGSDMDRVKADHMGMLATMINAMALEDSFRHAGIDALVMTSIGIEPFARTYSPEAAREALADGRVVIFGGGLGLPFFSTDTAAAQRAAEIGADAILMAKNIDGVYSADPKKDKNAVRYDEITYSDIIAKDLRALDLTAAAFCLENNICAYAFELKDPMNIYRVAFGEKIGTEMHK